MNQPIQDQATSLESLTCRWRALIGRECARVEYSVEARVIREYADLFGYSSARFHSRDAAVAEGYRSLVAPAAFGAVYTMHAVLAVLHDPILDVPFAWNLHAGQLLNFGEPVCAGDLLTTIVTLQNVAPKPPNLFYALGTRTTNAEGAICATGTSTHVVRVP